ncbi:fluoride efflux transporter CrcB [Paenibacillus abyssi]|uniref:Fluoride-specific ion channel FluC n=1 Tax=Paenibacillus abyssi TaxID=1340531 RepID=A0A917D5G2_9BACL|nr:fluoride efflux transporter CrcB [Paenibacillus abyssi]GGG09487.1 putative fluoride ion transporter CrcB 2 [Paenibacillus abyssi]
MRTILAVAAAGAMGAAARFGIGTWLMPGETGLFPWATFVCNCLGSFALGSWLGYCARRPSVPNSWKEAVGTGFIGAFTTFSAFSAETIELLRHDYAGTAMIYIIASFVGGILMAWLGLSLSRLGGARNG